MEAKFVNFDDVIEKLGITAERLHELREEGQLRAYRDGKSWKFRTDEIEGMVQGGVPDAPPPSDVGLVSPADLVEAAPIDSSDEDDFELSLVDEEPAAAAEKSDPELELGLDDTDAVPGDSGIEIAGLDDTVTTSGSDIALDLELPEAGPSDSILLSEATLGESVSGSPSTIIGKDKIGADDADLELALDDDVTAEKSDVKLSPAAGASDVLSANVAGSGVLDDQENASGGTSAFKDLDELEIDLSAESSRILSPEEVAEAKSASKSASAKQEKSAASSDLELADLELAEDDSNIGSTDAPVLESDKGSDSGIDLAGDSDLILADAGGSDLTLDSGDSGINLISPSDSGLALDDIPLEMGGSAILSSLSLEGSDPEISLIADDVGSSAGEEPMAELQTDDDFQLTPLSEGATDEGDSSSQVIALDADIEDFSDGAAVLEEEDFAEEEGDVLSGDFAEAPAGDLDMGYAPVAAAAVAGTPYSMLNIIGLGSSALLLMLAGTMMLDMMRNIWSWEETYTLNSALMDAILGWF